MKKAGFWICFAVLVLAAAYFAIQWKNKKHTSSDIWVEDFKESFDRDTLGHAWFVPADTKKSTILETKEGTLFVENSHYSPYSEIWLAKKYEGAVKIEFDLKIQLKRGGEFGVRLAHSQTEILPNTPGYEIYFVALTSAIVKRADRDEQVAGTVSFSQEVLRGEKFVHVVMEKNYRKVRLWADENLILDLPDPELLSGRKYSNCGIFLIAGKAAIKNLKVSVFQPEKSDLLAQAYEFYNNDDYSKALMSIEKFLKENSDHKRSLEARLRKALCLKYMGNYNESSALLQALQFNVIDQEYVPDALFFLGEIYQKLKQYENAIKYYSGFIERYSHHPYVPKTFERLALCQWSLKQYNEALHTTIKLQEQYPGAMQSIHAHYFRGQVYEALNEKGKALKEYQTLLSLVQKDLVANLARKALRKLASGGSGGGVATSLKKNIVEITYKTNPDRTLKNPMALILHWGRNGWQKVQDAAMTITDEGWKAEISIEKEMRSIEFVFTDGQGNWDNNNGLNWELPIPQKQ